MIDSTIKDRLFDELERLSPEQLAEVYRFAHALAAALPPGASVAQLEALAGAIDGASARQMTEAIDEAFERVDPSDW